MKLSLAIVLTSLSVLTTAKPGLVNKYHHHHHLDKRTCRQRPTLSHSSPTNYPITPSAYTKAPTNMDAHTSSSTHYDVVPTTHSSGWVQNPKGEASFTAYPNCQSVACGYSVNGYSAAVNELAFGASSGAGGACGRCFRISANKDPFTPSYAGPFGNSIVVKVTDMCPALGGSNKWCSQRVSEPLNTYGMPMHFDLCTASGAARAFFPGGSASGAMLGTYEEVPCSEWSGTDNKKQWDGACMAGESAGLWPELGCPNNGNPPA